MLEQTLAPSPPGLLVAIKFYSLLQAMTTGDTDTELGGGTGEKVLVLSLRPSFLTLETTFRVELLKPIVVASHLTEEFAQKTDERILAMNNGMYVIIRVFLLNMCMGVTKISVRIKY